jgi:hypothetical protein
MPATPITMGNFATDLRKAGVSPTQFLLFYLCPSVFICGDILNSKPLHYDRYVRRSFVHDPYTTLIHQWAPTTGRATGGIGNR